MTHIERLFLEAYCSSIQNKSVNWTEALSEEEWLQFFALASKHKALPLVFNAVYNSEAAKKAPAVLIQTLKQQMITQVTFQMRKTAEFKQLYKAMNQKGIYPIVLKGIVLRSLYPNPDYRPSGDEDLLIDPSEFNTAHNVMESLGFHNTTPIFEPVHQVAYAKQGSVAYFELHQSFFSDDSDIYGDMNHYFAHAREHFLEQKVDEITIHTLGFSEHFLFLIFHALKHFVNCGVGIRQIADICLFAGTYGSQLDWDWILTSAKEVYADVFLQAVLQIGEKYLAFDPVKACLPKTWNSNAVDENAMLEDILSGGVYGKDDSNRIQGSKLVQNAVEDDRKGRHIKTGMIRRVFPSAKTLKVRYEYLDKQPYRLPLAWVDRIWTFMKDVKGNRQGNISSNMQYKDRKLELIRQYGIIREK